MPSLDHTLSRYETFRTSTTGFDQELTDYQGRDGFLVSTVGPPLTKVRTVLRFIVVRLTTAGTNRGPKNVISRI